MGVTDSHTRGDCSCMGLEGGHPQERMERTGFGTLGTPGFENKEKEKPVKTERAWSGGRSVDSLDPGEQRCSLRRGQRPAVKHSERRW